MKIYLAWIFSLMSLTALAQTISTSRTYPVAAPGSSEYESRQEGFRYHVDSIRGSRFLYDDFIPGTVHFKNKTKATDLLLRLNIYHDEFQYVKNKAIRALATPNSVDRITLGGEEFIYLDQENNSNLSGFVRIWNAQFPAIVTKMSTTVREGDYNYTIPPRFEREDDQHYFMRSENDITKIKSVKHLIYLLCYYSPELEEFAKQEKISSTDGADLAWLLEHYQKMESRVE